MRLPPPDISIVHPFDPWQPGIGGFDSCLLGFLEFAPPPLRIEVIGVTTDPVARPVGKRSRRQFGDRAIDFTPVLADFEPERARRVPMSLRFVVAARLAGVRPRGRIVQVHRFETCYAIPRGFGGKLALFLHNHPPELTSAGSDRAWRHLPRIYNRAVEAAVRRADAVFGVDPRTASYLGERWPPSRDRFHTFPPWANPRIFHPGEPAARARARSKLRRELNLEPETELIVFPGRLERQKDPVLLANVFARLAAIRKDCTLAVYGKGRFRRALTERFDNEGLSPRVRFLPPVSREDLAERLRASDALICTSFYEAGPRTVLEALACGCPVVSTDVGLARELLASEGVLGRVVKGRDSAGIAGALAEVLAAGHPPGSRDRRSQAVSGFTPTTALEPVFQRYASWGAATDLSPAAVSLPGDAVSLTSDSGPGVALFELTAAPLRVHGSRYGSPARTTAPSRPG